MKIIKDSKAKSIKKLLCAMCVSLAPSVTLAQGITDISLEDALNTVVTTSGRKAENAFKTSAATYVVDSEDIRRSGATTVPELLRMVPGVQVAQLSSNTWGVGFRDGPSPDASSALVMIDGRSIVDQRFLGVAWEVEHVAIDNIERIEVTRGPGGTLWGSNAISGVVNIITKASSSVQGMYASTTGASDGAVTGFVRYGGKADNTSYQIYASSHRNDNGDRADGSPRRDAASGLLTGFKAETELNSQDKVVLSGDFGLTSNNTDGQTRGQSPGRNSFTEPGAVELVKERDQTVAGNVTAHYTHTISPTSEFNLQGYLDQIDRDDSEKVHKGNTEDIEFTHRFSPLEDHDVVWGASARGYQDLHAAYAGQFGKIGEHGKNSFTLFSGFVQDEITIVKDTFNLIVGSKVERYSPVDHLQFEPSARLLWTPSSDTTIWTAVSKLDRNPQMEVKIADNSEFNLDLGDGLVTDIRKVGTNDFKAVETITEELGIRHKIDEKSAIDVAGFHGIRTNYQSVDYKGDPFIGSSEYYSDGSSHLVVPFSQTNSNSAEYAGGELAGEYLPTSWWKVKGSYSYLWWNIWHRKETADVIFINHDEDIYNHFFEVRSLIDLPNDMDFDTTWRYANGVRGNTRAQSFNDVDVRLAWRPAKDWELAVVGQNLLHEHHVEDGDYQVARRVLGKLNFTF